MSIYRARFAEQQAWICSIPSPSKRARVLKKGALPTLSFPLEKRVACPPPLVPFFGSFFSVFRVSKEDFTGKEEEEEQGAVNFVSFFSLSLCKVPPGQTWGDGGEGRCFFGSKFTRKKTMKNFKRISNFFASLPKVFGGIFASKMANPAPDKQFAAKEEEEEEIERENSNSGPRSLSRIFLFSPRFNKETFLFLSKTKKGERKLEMRK